VDTKRILLVLFLCGLFASFCYAGDYRRDGAYVAPYNRPKPDSVVRSNYDYKGNVNPYTDKEGYNYYPDTPKNEYYQPDYQSRPPQDVYVQPPSYNKSSKKIYNTLANDVNPSPIDQYAYAIPIGILILLVVYIFFKALRQ